MQNPAVTVVLPVALGIIMLGLGLTLTPADFRRVLTEPRAVLIGLLVQMVLLPAICFGLVTLWGLPPELAVGMMLLAAAPGGATANLFSHLAHGDVALNVTLTATNSLLALFTTPLIVGASLAHFMSSETAIPIPTDKVISVFAVVLIPIAIGMTLRAKKPQAADRLERPVRIASAIFLALVVFAALLKDRANVVDYIRQIGLPALAFNVASLVVGYLVPLALRLPKKQAVAIGMEIGIHNGTLAIAIASTVLGNDRMTIPPAVYSLIMFFTAAGFAVLVNARKEPSSA